jgi:hypothetical protein
MEEQKPKRGRPATVGTKGNKEYFREYYHATKKTEMCECGIVICSKQRCKHIKTKLHLNLMKNKLLGEEEELNICRIL